MISLRSCFLFLPFQDQERRTPLHAAAYVGDVPILQLLLMSGESGELEGVALREGEKSLHTRGLIAGAWPGNGFLSIPVPHCDCWFPFPHPPTPNPSNPNEIGNCVHTGANVNAKDTLWLTPLHRAAASRNEVWTPPQFTFPKRMGGREGLEKLSSLPCGPSCPT